MIMAHTSQVNDVPNNQASQYVSSIPQDE